MLRAIFEACIEHPTIDDRVHIDYQCGHTAFIAVPGLCRPGHMLIRDLEPLLRSHSCGARTAVNAAKSI